MPSVAILNSSRLSDCCIKDILKFLRPFFHKKVFKKLEIHFVDWSKTKHRIYVSGRSYNWCPARIKKIDPKSKYFITIDIGTKIKFPYLWVYKPSAPAPKLRNLKEATLHTLAHELFHIECWRLGNKPKQEEVEAEKVAHRILKEYRKLCYNK